MKLKTKEQIESMRAGGKILALILRELVKAAQPGVVTQDLDKLARELLKQNEVQPSFLGYTGFPSVLCTSVNDEAVHTVPSSYELKDGDVLKLDFGVIYKGLHTDSAVTIIIGKDKSPEKKKLLNVTREALYAGISEARVGNTVGDIGAAIQELVEKSGFKILKELGGHGVGETLHEEPFIPNFGQRNQGEKLQVGMVIAIEPITAVSTWKIKDGDDGHTFVTHDGSLSAQFEHTVAITEKGPWVLTEI